MLGPGCNIQVHISMYIYGCTLWYAEWSKILMVLQLFHLFLYKIALVICNNLNEHIQPTSCALLCRCTGIYSLLKEIIIYHSSALGTQ